MTERAERLRREVWRWLRLAREDLDMATRILERAAEAATTLVGGDPDEQAAQP